MNIKRILTWAGLTAGTALALFASPAGAAGISFAPFSFSTSFTGSAPKGDIWLNSVTTTDSLTAALGTTYGSFELVSGANIIHNDSWTGGDTGAASSDRGDNASGVVLEAATNASIVASLGNLNLNNIIDTEDRGSFVIDLFFNRATDRFFFWERGMNSSLLVQALDDAGNKLAEYLLDSSTSNYAGYSIDTVEINHSQRVGAQGLWLNGARTNRLRLIANGAAFNGPDFKVVAASVPEPATIAGTVLAAGAAIAARRKRKAQAEV
ncbi:PEP-CTERM sorting domain-containing protein [Thermoleptolyngbya sichuanensis A183]|uniref:PEP-CTERM sorting domain-containing protein n=1 Tax=Thermoleptolyngbya sichuanensis A183 TaxID=2737172 RepID=A0A6M8BD74_9CYAN|nr:exosortase-dependent surface protein XDP2 [Thermoleptolyngbya sichuanensis]QKD84718.1 PEP-CTERM sorting domain-containing protein [Thermoleptolyngbya sichuanensis A183]